ncbi:NAD-dependent epimerase/dehydratase family protein [Ketobacter nezhaii]|uniref:NAD-dependent epimerase/dehydratase family protein n=1 Tax=Ketobacter sp. MCCC 1A13808 TaxID=2602738 RepID=UPI001E62D682|nr:NAD-dependent epimerase/dehydratase family protein [Ketobacter sp. MCCC 1A13808]
MRCMVTGGRGFIGSYLIKELCQQDIKIISTSRKSVESELTIECVQLNHGVDQVPPELLDGIDTIFHLANVAHTELSSDEQTLYRQVNVKGTRDLLEAAVKSAVRMFVYVSSVKACGQPDDEYGRSKLQAENLVLSYGKKYGIQVAVVRPALVYGPGVKGNLYSMMSAIARGRFPWAWVCLPEFGNIRSMVSVHDVVSALILVAFDKSANGKVYTLTDGEPYTPCQLQNGIYQAAGLPRPWLVVPGWCFAWAAVVGQSVQAVTRIKLPFNQSVYDKLTASAQYDASEIRGELGWRPQHTYYTELPPMLEALYGQRIDCDI